MTALLVALASLVLFWFGRCVVRGWRRTEIEFGLRSPDGKRIKPFFVLFLILPFLPACGETGANDTTGCTCRRPRDRCGCGGPDCRCQTFYPRDVDSKSTSEAGHAR